MRPALEPLRALPSPTCCACAALAEGHDQVACAAAWFRAEHRWVVWLCIGWTECEVRRWLVRLGVESLGVLGQVTGYESLLTEVRLHCAELVARAL